MLAILDLIVNIIGRGVVEGYAFDVMDPQLSPFGIHINSGWALNFFAIEP